MEEEGFVPEETQEQTTTETIDEATLLASDEISEKEPDQE